jgi:hypothetical protein
MNVTQQIQTLNVVVVEPKPNQIIPKGEPMNINVFVGVTGATVKIGQICPTTFLDDKGNGSYVGSCTPAETGIRSVYVDAQKGAAVGNASVSVHVVPSLEVSLLEPLGILCESEQTKVKISVKKEGAVVENTDVVADGTAFNYENETYSANFFIVPNMQLTITASDRTVNKTKTFSWNTTNRLDFSLNISASPSERTKLPVMCGIYETKGNYTAVFSYQNMKIERKIENGSVVVPEIAGTYNITVYGKDVVGREINETKTIEIKPKNNIDFLYLVVGGTVIIAITVYLLFLR